MIIDIEICLTTGDIDHRQSMEPTGLGSIEIFLAEGTFEIALSNDIRIRAHTVVEHCADTINRLDHPLAEPVVDILAQNNTILFRTDQLRAMALTEPAAMPNSG